MQIPIIRRGGASLAGSSSAGLNFTVVGGTEQPVNLKENTIWVNTETEITKWVVSVDTPSNPEQGNVWIGIVIGNDARVDLIDENDINLPLGGAKQYNGSAWVTCDAKIYQAGQWSDLDTTIYMIKDGKFIRTPNMTPNAVFEEKDGYITFKGGSPGYWCGWFADIEIDGTSHSQLIFKGTFFAGGTDAKFYFAIWDATTSPSEGNCQLYKNYSSGTSQYSVDVSSLNGTYHVGLVSTYTYEQQITAMYLAE